MKKLYLHFSKSMAYMIIVCMAVSVVPRTGLAQENANQFIEVSLMKVAPGDEGSYVELEQNIWKPIHQERINQGIIVGWVLYQVMYTGADDPYNYVTVSVYADPANLEAPYEGIDLGQIHPNVGEDIVSEATLGSRGLVKTHLMSRENYTFPEGGESPGSHEYIVVNYMRSMPDSDFLQFQDEWGKPTAAELVSNGDWAGWSVWSTVFPRGTGLAFDYTTVDYFPDFAKVLSADYMAAYLAANPDREWSEFVEQASSATEIVRTELWRVVDIVVAE